MLDSCADCARAWLLLLLMIYYYYYCYYYYYLCQCRHLQSVADAGVHDDVDVVYNNNKNFRVHRRCL